MSHPIIACRKMWKALLLLMLVPLFGSWFAVESRDLLYFEMNRKDRQGQPWCTVSISFLLLLSAVGFAAWAAQDLFRARNVHIGFKREPDPHPHLVLFLLSGLAKHQTVLRSVTLICSPQSLLQAHWFAAIVTDIYRGEFPILNQTSVQIILKNKRRSI
jgi:hypothetical protein